MADDPRPPLPTAAFARWRLGLAGALLAVASLTTAAATTAPLTEPALEARVTRLAEELRCLVCQNQSLADSQAPLAVDLKNQVRAQLAQGRSEAEVRDYLVLRYGEFVLYRPPLRAGTWLLWFAPLGLVLAGLALLGWRWRQAQDGAESDAESDPHVLREPAALSPLPSGMPPS